MHNVTKQGNTLADDKATALRYRIILPDHAWERYLRRYARLQH